MSSAPDLRQVRAALFLSIGLGFVGFFGVTAGLGQLAAASAARPSAPAATGNAQEDALAALMFAQQDLIVSMPYAPALGSMNLVVSATLVIGSFMLSARSKNAAWWIRNATLANALYVVIDTVTVGAHLAGNLPRLRPLLDAWIAASARAAGTTAHASTATGTITGFVIAGVVFGLFRLGIQALLYRRVGSEPVRGFLASAE
jgi:hypothetical protein